MQRTGAQIIWECLVHEGVRTVFGYPGGAILPAYDAMTVTGKTLAENVKDVPPLKAGQQVIQPVEKPVFPRGHLRILRGNLAPDGAVAKITGKEGERFSGPAKVFDSEEDM